MSAMPAEIESIDAMVEGLTIEQRGGREYARGTILGQPVVVVHSRCGKVAAATTATDLIAHFGARHIVFTGVAGALAPSLRVGDVVVGTSYLQHDLDARPLFPRYEVPLLGVSRFAPEAMPRAVRTVEDFLAHDLAGAVPGEDLEHLSIESPSCVRASRTRSTSCCLACDRARSST